MRDGGGFQLTFDNGERGDSFIFFLLKGCIAIGKLILSKFGIERLQLFGDGIYIRLAVQRLDTKMRELQQRIGHQQLIAFLNGPGGTGKSHVVSAIVRYCKKLCENLQINFDKRTIVVTAMSGSAAVSINGETAHMACCTNKRGPIPIAEIERWKHAYLLIIDEISFASKAFLDQLNKCLGQLLQNANAKFGGIHILFVGDMSQLDPVGQKPMYRETDLPLWTEWVDIFLELKTNHRFKNDPKWGEILCRFRNEGPTIEDVNTIINTRVLESPTGPRASDIPADSTYATASNLDCVAINDGIFAKHLASTHSKNPNVEPPKHMICIKASNLKWKEDGRTSSLNNISKDILYACCGEAHVFSGRVKKNTKSGKLTPSREKMYSPLLKIYYDRPMMLTDNLDVENGLANGSMCNVREVILSDGITYQNLEKIQIDGYYVWCADVSQVREIKLQLQEGDMRVISLKAHTIGATVEFPVPIFGTVDKRTDRWFRKMSMTQFHLNEANARTVHKLQGKSLKYVVINSFKNFGHWAYVALSHVKALNGLFLRSPVDFSKCR
jgi:PIF1-like helicase